NAYDSIASLRELEGMINIYLPDLKYASNYQAKKLSRTADYVKWARPAIKEMHRQVGNVILDESGMAQRGLIVRHLILPDGLAGSEESLTWLAQELSPAVTVSIMSQYLPAHRARQTPVLSRTISTAEYETVLKLLSDLGMENGWVQEMGASDNYVPDFEREGHPFSSTHKITE
ncbi:radical SAM protein, partial [Chloroflexota bacterium]